MPAPVRYPNGVTDRSVTHPLASLPVPDPTKYVVFHDDFTDIAATAAGVSNWHLDEVDGGTASVDLAISDAHGGVATFTVGTSANDNTNYQWAVNTTVAEIFKLEAGKRAWLRAKFKTEDADQDAVALGLHITGDDKVGGTELADTFWFRSALATPATLEFACGKTNSTEVTIALGTLADDTWSTCTAYYDGAGTVYAWREVAGVVVASGSVSVTSSTPGDLLPDTELTVGFGMEGIDTGADVFSIDFITVITDR